MFIQNDDMKYSTININGKLLSLENPIVMGILNITPDSFYDGGKFRNENEVIAQVAKMLNEGATIIDIGAQSTRPRAEFLSKEIEIERLLPILKVIRKEFPEAIISIDTFYSQVVRACYDEGVNLINDISGGGIDTKMFETAAQLKLPYILMHSRGTPQTMQSMTGYENLVGEVYRYFTEKISLLKEAGVHDIIIDLGFGFAKTTEQNFELLKKMKIFKTLEYPILTGISRKGMIYKSLDTSAENSLNGTTVINTYALLNGSKILRVHDVKEAMEAIKLCSLLIK